MKNQTVNRFSDECPPWDICDFFPCKHSSFSTDEDYLADMKDRRTDRELYDKVWWLYRQPSQLELLSPDDAEKYSARLARCQRIMARWGEIKAEIVANKNKYVEDEWGFPSLKGVALNEEERAALNEGIRKKIRDAFPRNETEEEKNCFIVTANYADLNSSLSSKPFPVAFG